ncbi:glycosyltransferase 87 family protein [Pandoraea sp. CB10b_02]|uniref:glycosyltransferase 87 family protein n=1 Tax=Pandoraea sp. CB10b_02 TaxID=2014535 RepID=UPI00257D3E38|nr:glycosyltransferase 87 family protein [Pandoraea sp. CB10b_02]
MTSKSSAAVEKTLRERRHWSEDRARIRLYSGAGLLCLVGVIVLWWYLHFLAANPKVGPIGLDFLPFWGASHFVLQGHPLDAYNVEIMSRAQIAALPYAEKMGGYMPWLYPPVMMLLLAPIALLPFAYAYVVYACIGYGAYYATLRRTAPWRAAGCAANANGSSCFGSPRRSACSACCTSASSSCRSSRWPHS